MARFIDDLVIGAAATVVFFGGLAVSPKYDNIDNKLSAKIQWAQSAYANEVSKKYVKLGEEKYAAGDLDGALIDFKEAIKEDKNEGEAYNNIAVVLRQKGDFSGALPYHEMAVKIENNDIVYRNLGFNYYKLGKKEKAISAFKKAIELNPNDTKSKGWLEYLR